MKKSMMFFALIFGVSSVAFSIEETWLSVGYQQAFFIDTYKDQGTAVETYTVSRGTNLSVYRFFTDNVGIFINSPLLLFPTSSWVLNDNGLSTIDLNDYAINSQTGLIAGVAFKTDLTDDFKAYFGIGFDYLFTSAVYPGSGNVSYFKTMHSLGLGTDAGVKVDLADKFFVRLGSTFTFDFARYTELETYNGVAVLNTASGWDKGFATLSAMPYISVGVNFFWTEDNGRFRLVTGKEK